MNRNEMLANLGEQKDPWDLIVIGGGATGLGTAVDAASRGYSVVLLEQSDFAKGTSSRSTKLVHGGVRYLQQGNVSLVMEALKERGILLHNAPHLVSDQAFIVPSYAWWASPFYGIGMKVYDMLAGRYGFGTSSVISREEVINAIPSIRQEGLQGGTKYYDGQFDDARLAMNLATSVYEHGGTVLNYMRVEQLCKDENGFINGVTARDLESDQLIEIKGHAVVNATGPFADEVRRMDRTDAAPIIAPSQGVHIVLDRSFLSGDSAIMVPHTDDGRVMFAIPWHDVTVVGTTDTPIEETSLEPKPFKHEVEFILETANRYLARPANANDIKSVFVGIRPLVKIGDSENTASLSRDHTIIIEPESGLLTVAGGKWTTYRKMAQDVVDQVITLADLEPRECITKQFPIHGYHRNASRFGRLAIYGSDAIEIQRLEDESPENAQLLDKRLPLSTAEVIWACRREMARTVDDVLSRRSRCLLFDARASIDVSKRVATIMAQELGFDEEWCSKQCSEFRTLAEQYVFSP